MRGNDPQQGGLFGYISPEQRVRKDHPLRPIRARVDQVLKELSPRFDKMYAKVVRPSIPPEQLLRALLLQMLYSVRSERVLVEEVDYNILFRWFVGLNLDDPVWDATTFTKNRDRLLEAEVAKEFQMRVVKQAREQGWTSDEHFTVDGTLLEAWASLKSFQPKDKEKKDTCPPDDPGNPTVNFHGEKRSNQTHESKSDPEALHDQSMAILHQQIPAVTQLGLLALAFARQHAAARSGKGACDRGRRQGLRHRGIRERVSPPGHDTAHIAEHRTKRRQCHRQPHHATSGLCPQPEEEEAHRRMLRLAEDHRAAAQTAAPRRTESGLDFLSRLRSLQSGAHAKLDGCYRSGAVSLGRSVSEGCENADHEHPTTRKIAAKPTPYSEMTQQGEKSARATQFFSGLLE